MAKKKASEDVLSELHNLVAMDLIAKIKRGEATAQELNAAIKFLKDNGIETTGEKDTPMMTLARSLPTFDDDDSYQVN
jgi:hypothetical protein